MSEKEAQARMVSPTGRIVFIRDLFVSGGDKDRFSAALVFSGEQDLSKVKKMMRIAGVKEFDEKTVKGAKFSWGVKKVDTDEIDFLEEGDLIMNFDRNGTFGPPEVKGTKKGPDGKYEDLIDGDLKAGDFCRVLISPFAWEHKGKKGVKLNFEAVQFIKEGEAFYTPPTSDDAWDETEFDEEPEEREETSEETSSEGEDEDWDDDGF